MTGHTPGPWIVDERFGGCVRGGPHVGYARGSGQEQIVMVVSRSNAPPDVDLIAERDANARLIAAAPELLAALKAALDESGCDGDLCMYQWHDAARAAIKKAEGE